MNDTDAESIADRSLPPALATALERAYGLSTRPATIGDWVTATEERLGEMGLSVGYEELCTTEDGPHVAHFDGRTQAFVCVLDTFLLPYASDVSGPIEVESTTPVGGSVRFTVTRSDIETRPEGAVVSVGVATDVDPPGASEVSPELAYSRLCPYIHAFRSQGDYADWADGLDGAETIALPAAAGFDLAGLIAGGDRFFPGGGAE